MSHTILNYNENIEQEILIINVSGCHFEIYRNILQKYPETLLGSSKIESFYNKNTKEYYFNRDAHIFRFILNYYRTDKLHFPKDECSCNYEEELKFFDISPEIINDCCYQNYHNYKNELNYLNTENNKSSEDNEKKMNLKEKTWQLLENPHSSKYALLFYLISNFFTIISTLLIIIEKGNCGHKPGRAEMLKCGERYTIIFFYLKIIFIFIFTIEYLCRFFTTPNKLKFIRSFLTIIDLIVIIPFYYALLIKIITQNDYTIGSLIIWRFFRLLNIFRFPYNVGALKILDKTIRSSALGVGFFLTLFLITNLLCATFLYNAECNVNGTNFTSIMRTLWYTFCTTTTIGYGDMIPETLQGRIIGSVCALMGITIIFITISYIAINFLYILKKYQKINKLKTQKQFKLIKN